MVNWYRETTLSIYIAICANDKENLKVLLADGRVAKNLPFPYLNKTSSWQLNVLPLEHQNLTWLGIALLKGNDAVVKVLLDHGFNLDHINDNGNTSLTSAILGGHDDVAMMLINEGASVELHSDEQLLNPLCHALEMNKVMIVSKLINAGANVNHIAKLFRRTPAHSAAINGNVECFKLLELSLIQADFGMADNKKQTPLHLATTRGRTYAVEWLIASGVSIDPYNDSMETPLVISVKRNYYDIMDLLIRAGCNVGWTDDEKNTLLHIAAKCGSYNCLMKLVDNDDAKSIVNLLNASNESAMDIVIDDNLYYSQIKDTKLKMVNALLDIGAKPTYHSLEKAAYQGNNKVVQSLVKHGANTAFINHNGENLLHMIASSNKPSLELLQFMIKHYTTQDTPLKVLIELEKSRKQPANQSGLMRLPKSILLLIKTFLDFSEFVNMQTFNGTTPVVQFIKHGIHYHDDYIIIDPDHANFYMAFGHDEYHYNDGNDTYILDDEVYEKMRALQNDQQITIFAELLKAVKTIGGNVFLEDCDGYSVKDWIDYAPSDTYRPRLHVDRMNWCLMICRYIDCR